LTGCCLSAKQHSLRKLFAAGVLVTLNTDDPEMFRTNLSREYQIAQDSLGFTESELCRLAQNSFRASFLTGKKKQDFIDTI